MLEKDPGKTAARPKAGVAKPTTTKAAAKAAPKTAAPRPAARGPRAGTAPSADLRALVQKLAYELWERDGRPEGREQAHWEEAERQITARRAA